MIIALAGRRVDALDAEYPRFPLKNVEIVGMNIRRLLEQLKPKALVCSAACGADLLALAAARELNIRHRLILPSPKPLFRASSVVDRPGDWGELFDSIYEEAAARDDVIIVSDNADDEAAYTVANEKIVAEALSMARVYKEDVGQVRAVIVWNGVSRGNDDVTVQFAELAKRQGIQTMEIKTI